MFDWDGSDITDLLKNENTTIYEGKNEKKKYWIIENEDITETVGVKSSSHMTPSLIDELKPIFNLEKVGTHWGKLNGKIYILFSLEREKNEILQELTLDKYKYDKRLEKEIRKIFLFRELLGVSQNFEKDIILRKKNLYIQPISFHEANIKPSTSGKVLSNLILEKWFIEKDLDQAVCEFFEIDNLENVNNVLLPLKDKLEKVITRVDPNSIMYVDEILSRIRSRLQFILS